MNNLIKLNTVLNKADASIQIANKLLAGNDNLPELIPYRKGEKWGYCDRNKKIVIDCSYDDADIFSDGFALVKIGCRYNYIGLHNNLLFANAELGGVSTAYKFKEGYALFGWESEDSWDNYCYIDVNGNVFAFHEICNEFNGEEIGRIETQFDSRLVNKKGEEIGPAISRWGETVCGYSEGFVLIYTGVYFFRSLNEYLNGNTNFKESESDFSEAKLYREGRAAVKGNKWGYIDHRGQHAIPAIYDSAKDFSEGLAAVELNGKYGFIDKQGIIIIPFEYDNAWSFSEGLALANSKSHFVFIDKKGHEIINLPHHAEAESFSNGLSEIFLPHKGKLGYIDKKGTQYWED